MIKMQVRDEHMTQAPLLAQAEDAADRSGVHQHGLVDQKGAGPAFVTTLFILDQMIGAVAA